MRRAPPKTPEGKEKKKGKGTLSRESLQEERLSILREKEKRREKKRHDQGSVKEK